MFVVLLLFICYQDFAFVLKTSKSLKHIFCMFMIMSIYLNCSEGTFCFKISSSSNINNQSLIYIHQRQFGCGILKMVGPKMQDFCPRINMFKGIFFKKILRRLTVRQKLGMILENKVVQKLKLEKNIFLQKMVS